MSTFKMFYARIILNIKLELLFKLRTQVYSLKNISKTILNKDKERFYIKKKVQTIK